LQTSLSLHWIRNIIHSFRNPTGIYSRRKTFPESIDDYSIRIDGLTAGRIMKMKGGFQRVFWLWNLTAPHDPHRTYWWAL
jgi:hypothetical protein